MNPDLYLNLSALISEICGPILFYTLAAGFNKDSLPFKHQLSCRTFATGFFQQIKRCALITGATAADSYPFE
jgi:hypothetical protein